jgi:DNA-binding beta-propeller fold protein YncE
VKRPCIVLLVLSGPWLSGCGSRPVARPTAAAAVSDTVRRAAVASTAPARDLPGMPPLVDSANVYAGAAAGQWAPAVHDARSLVYVPLGGAASVAIIDPATYRVTRVFHTAALPQHVVPAYDLRTLWVANDIGNSLTPIDPTTGREGPSVPVDDPYNLYFTPDGKYAVVIAERAQRIDFRDPHTMALHDSVRVDCRGVDHMDFTADGRTAVATCEFSGKLLQLDVATHRVTRYVQLDSGRASMPQDIRLSPDGRSFFIADMQADGVFVLDARTLQRETFIPTGRGTHGIYPSRDGRLFYVSNRGAHTVWARPHGPGSISVVDPARRAVIATWPIPGGGSPDMGNVSADGAELWLSGRYDEEVYVFDTRTGRLAHRIPVGRGPHGLTVWPQPGRYSLGHTGNMR